MEDCIRFVIFVINGKNFNCASKPASCFLRMRAAANHVVHKIIIHLKVISVQNFL